MTIQITTLSNGLRIATDSMADAESAVVGAWVGVGTRHEPKSANGVAHLVEHMMFKGTKKRSAYAISTAIEQKGGSMNAHTSREETAYYARVMPEDTDLGLDIIADMLQRSKFDPKELDRERKVIIQEIGRDYDTPEEHASELLQEVAFPNQAIGRSILGSAKVIENLPRDKALDYVNRFYHAGNMVIVAAGKVDHEAFVKLVQRHFGRLPRGKMAKIETAKIRSGEIRQSRDIEQLHLFMAFAGPGRFARDVYAASLLGVVLGGSSSSRLFQKVREERGLVYTVSASHMAYADVGMLNIYAGTDPARAGELIPVMCRELVDVTHNIAPKEFKRAQAQIRADLLMGQESVMRRAETLGHQMLIFGKPISTEETLEKYMAVTIDETHAVARKMFARKPIIAALGPLDQLESYKEIAKRLAA